MPHVAQLDWAKRESHIWSRHRRWSRSNSTPYLRELKSREVTSRELCKQEASTLRVWCWRSCVLKGFANEGREEVWGERETSTSLYQTIPHPWEMWNRSLEAGVTTIVGRSSWHLPCIAAEEVPEGTRGCYITRSGTTPGRLDVSRASDQDLRSKESCHKAQDDQVFQDSMKQPYCRRRNMGKQRFPPFSPSKFQATVVRERATFRCPC
jgi:hypothetical protein